MEDLSDLIWKDQPVKPLARRGSDVGASLSALAAQSKSPAFGVNLHAASPLNTLGRASPAEPTRRSSLVPGVGMAKSASSPKTLDASTGLSRPAANGGGTFWKAFDTSPPKGTTSGLRGATASRGSTPNLAAAQASPASRPPPSNTSAANGDPFDQLLGLTPPKPSGSPTLASLNAGIINPVTGKKISLVELERKKIEERLQNKKSLESQWDLNFLDGKSSRPSSGAATATGTITSPAAKRVPIASTANFNPQAASPLLSIPSRAPPTIPASLSPALSARATPTAATPNASLRALDPFDMTPIDEALSAGSPLPAWQSSPIPAVQRQSSNPLGILAEPVANDPNTTKGGNGGGAGIDAALGIGTPIPAEVLGRTGSPIPMFDSDDDAADWASPTASHGSRPDTALDGAIAQLAAEGFTADQAHTALAMTTYGRDVAQALEFLQQDRQAERSRRSAAPTSAARYRYQDSDDDNSVYIPAGRRQQRGRLADRVSTKAAVDGDDDGDDQAGGANLSDGSSGVYHPHNLRPSAMGGRAPPQGSRPGADESSPELGQQFQVHKERIMASANELGSTVFTKASSLFQMGKSRIQRTIEELQQQSEDTGENTAPRWMASNGPYAPQFSDEEEGAPARPPRQTRLSSSPSIWPQSIAPRFDQGRRASLAAFSSTSSRSSSDGIEDSEVAQRQEAALRARKEAYYREQAQKQQQRATTQTSSEHRPRFDRLPEPPLPDSIRTKPASARPATPASLYLNAPDRPPVRASMDQVLTAYLYKAEGNRQFKLGQFSEANTWYTRAIESLPDAHALRVPLHNNRAATNLKIGDHRQAIADCDVILEGSDVTAVSEVGMARSAGQKRALECGWYWWGRNVPATVSGPGDTSTLATAVGWRRAVQASHSKVALALPFTLPETTDGEPFPATADDLAYSLLDQRMKALQRKATSLESAEKFREALAMWQQVAQEIRLPIYSSSTETHMTPLAAPVLTKTRAAAQDGVRRCEQSIRMATGGTAKAQRPTPVRPSTAAAPRAPARASATPDLNPFRAPEAAAPDSARVQEIRQREREQQLEDQQRHQLKDVIDARVNIWRQGKETNLRALLASLDTLLWPELGWIKCGLHELVSNAKVKRAYLKAISKVHPDKLKPTESVEHRMLANSVFSTLNDSWLIFKTQNNL
ncbi:auxilin-like clathrin-binding protein required for normal clathrin function [Tieghemiomyces parasiticus]|uniref:Auxilin-like clathrin-binding protein required for normal clathrin function n=1 Tax=Tieghemiomyces parasiticus TaxID=78921 RepID=A0A9W8DLF5_9FUNG|nr:auxilin-like clathrin-binding protein required for normal clathrin function [Tieghemiomyces parasiticus]